MVSRCANPGCGAQFQYLSEGRLFHFEVAAKPHEKQASPGPKLVGQKKSIARVEHFWLCARCAGSMTLKFDKNEVVVVPLERRLRRAAAS
jgi:hypothetical protein